ncbi:unnamed protein product [Arctia plantaginis]|uniref:Major facilitator superfamily (MFS) profile domain-containing protein n=1 Tax=Arctia plantaginis TaxID=874455 RepID=A0A8S0YP42_ARCPL|nr:unnamed protein product [Arctia plantaginis]
MGQEDVQNGNQNKDTEKPVHDADILERIVSHLGDMGRYQKMLFVAMLPAGFTFAFIYFVQMFITVTPQNYWCRIPELANLSMEMRKNLSAPGIDGDYDHCYTFNVNWTEVLETLTPPPHGTPTIPCQHGWEFDFSDIPYQTVTTERGWVCDRSSYVPTAQATFFVGAVVGTIVFGWTADRFGRVPAIILTNLIGGIGSIGTSFTTDVWDFMLCRFIVGLSFDNCFMVLYVLVLEYVGLQYRTLVANLSMAFSFAIAGITLPWIAYYIADWRILMWVTAAPMFIVILAPWFLPESVRWLVSRGRVDDAVTVLKKFERINKTTIPDDIMNDFKIFAEEARKEERRSVLEMCKSSQLRKAMFSLLLMYMGGGIIFDGLMRLSDTFGLDFFALFSCYEVSELVAILLVVVILDKFGRRSSSSASAFISSVALLIAIFVPPGLPRAVLAIVARLFMITCLTCVMQWCTEIIPTPYRVSGVSILHMGAVLINTLSPFVVFSERVWSILPILIFTGSAFLLTGLCLTLPETKGLPMPQTRADGEKIINENTLFGSKKRITTPAVP